MTAIQYRWMEPAEVHKVGEIDRTERIRTGYKQSGETLQQLDVNWDTPAWSRDGDGEHTVAAHIQFCESHLQRNGRMFGAFDGEKLIGIGIIQPDVAKRTAQLAYLHVSNGYRQQGIGEQITQTLIHEAQKTGAKIMYVSATPSGSAVNFYLGQGFQPTDHPIPKLLELEPDDIHMQKDI